MSNALVFFAPGFEEIEAFSIVDILRRCQIEVTIVGLKRDVIEGAHEIKIIPDKYIEDIRVKDFDAVVCPGGSPGYENLKKDRRVIKMIKEAHGQKKVVAAICGAPVVLSKAGILNGKACTIYPGMEDELLKGGGKPVGEELVVVDENIITSKGPGTALVFSFKLAEKLTNRDLVEKVKNDVLANIVAKLQ